MGWRAAAWVAAGLAVGAVLAVVGWRFLESAPPVPSGAVQPVEFQVERGEGFASVAERLEERGLAVSALRLRILARLTRSDRAVRAGTYDFLPGTAPRDILHELVAGNVRLIRLTIPEGWRMDQIAAEVERVLSIPAAELVETASDPGRLAAVESRARDLEGYLFPETYYFPDGATAGEVVEAMTLRFQEEWGALGVPLPDGYDRHDIVTLASIIEAETRLPEEKPRVAAVYWNRLNLGWKLQADPTVRYGIQRFTGRLYYKHLDIDSPYNSYMYEGLPPGPIGAPGRASLLAALQPLEPCDDMYFVASGNGGHVFSRTRAEHRRAKHAARSGR